MPCSPSSKAPKSLGVLLGAARLAWWPTWGGPYTRHASVCNFPGDFQLDSGALSGLGTSKAARATTPNLFGAASTRRQPDLGHNVARSPFGPGSFASSAQARRHAPILNATHGVTSQDSIAWAGSRGAGAHVASAARRILSLSVETPVAKGWGRAPLVAPSNGSFQAAMQPPAEEQLRHDVGHACCGCLYGRTA